MNAHLSCLPPFVPPLVVFCVLAAMGCDKTPSEEEEPRAVLAPVGLTGMVLAIEGQPTGLRLETSGVTATLAGTQWSFGPGSTLQTDSATRAALVIGEGATVVLERDSLVRFPSDKARAIVLEQGRAVFEFPHREGATEPSAHVTVPTGEILLLGTKVSVDAFAEESTVTVSQGIVEARNEDEVIRAYPGDQIVLARGQSPRVLATPDLAESFGWSELAEDEETTATEVTRGIGKLVGKVPGEYREFPLEKHHQKVTVRIQGNVAYTEIHEIFHNPMGQTLEGLYQFPLPSDAQISRLSLKVGNRWMEGEFLETERAARIWRDVIERWRDPAWLRWQEGNQFELRIFPIDARTSREVIIGYTQRLTASGDGYRYVYPMPLDKGGAVSSKRFEFEGTILGMEAGQGVAPSGYKAAVEYGANAEDHAFARVRFDATDFVPAGDFSMRFSRRELVDTPQVHTYEQSRREGGKAYSLITLRPTLPRASTRESRDFVVVVDSSYTRMGTAFELTRRVISRLVKEMDPADRVTVVACNERCRPVGSPAFEAPSPAVETSLSAELAELEPRGSNHTVEALRVAARLLEGRDAGERSRSGHIIYFTDGIASAGALSPDELADASSRLLRTTAERLTLVDVGGNADIVNLQAMARGGRGTIVQLTPGETMSAQALQILNRHYGALLTEVSLELPPGMELVHPRHIEALTSGQEIVVAARVTRPVTGEILLAGRLGDERFERSYPVAIRPEGNAANSFVPRQWAQLRIRDLELEDGSGNRKEIIELSTKYGVLSRFTSLLAMESEEMMREYGLRPQERSDWRGDAMPEEAEARQEQTFQEPPSDLGASGVGAPTPAPRRAAPAAEASRAAPTKSRASNGPVLDAFDTDTALSGRGAVAPRPLPSPPPQHRERRHRPMPVSIPASATIRAAQPTTNWERGNIERRAKQLERDENNRQARLFYIRAFVRAGEVERAEREVNDWLETNPVDSEAIVQKAQLSSYQGRVEEALRLLASAVDASPRGEWIQTRIQAAYEARGDRALACAHAQSRVSIASKTRVDNPLSCPMATGLAPWGLNDDIVPAESSGADSAVRGNLVVTLSTEGDAEFEVLIIEPDGRILSSLSQRRRLRVEGMHDAGQRRIALPTLYRGTFKVRVVRVDSGKTPAQASVTVQALRSTQKYDVELRGQGGETVADVVYTPASTRYR